MPYFSKKSLSRLETCDLDLITLFNTVIENFDCTILEGYRSRKRQHELFLNNKSKKDGYIKASKHNYSPSLAVDVAPYPVNWSDTSRFYFFGGYVKAIAWELYNSGKITSRLRWGGDWDMDTDLKDQTFNDLVHFELIK